MIDKIDTSPEAVHKTGKAFLIAGSFAGAFFFFHQSHLDGWSGWDWQQGLESSSWKWCLGLGALLYLGGRVAYPLMRPFHIAWMAFAFILGWVNTKIVLGIFFYLVMTPVGLLMRLFRKDILEEKPNISAKTYWKTRESGNAGHTPADYERLF